MLVDKCECVGVCVCGACVLCVDLFTVEVL